MSRLNKIALTLACAAVVGAASNALAVPLYWDTNGNATDASYGGDGTWDTGNAYWNTSPTIGSGSLQAWTGGFADSPTFLRGTSGAVSVSGTISTGSISFGTSTGSFTTGTASYTLSGGTIDARVSSYGNVLNHSNGTTTINSTFGLFGGLATGNSNRQRINMIGGSLTLEAVQDLSGVTGTHELSLEGWGGGPLTINSITKSTGSAGITLLAGQTSTRNDYVYALGGNNTGLTGTTTLTRGTLSLNNSNALAGASSVTVANGNTTVAAADTANVLIGTAGVNLNKPITFAALTATDTSDIRSIGGTNTSGVSQFSGTVTLNAFAPSGTGASLRVTAESGGTTVFSNTINDGSNSVPIVKLGDGTVKFSRPEGNTYDGGTTISAGTLLASNTSGSATGTGNVVVSAAGTLGGTGFVDPGTGNTVTVSGKIAPGESVGTLRIGSSGSANDLIFLSGSQLVSEVADDSSDLLVVTGDVTLDGTLDVTFSGTQMLDRYLLVTYTGSRGGTEFDALVVHGSALPWEIDYSVPNEIAVVVPEPGSMAFLGAVTLALFSRRRRG